MKISNYRISRLNELNWVLEKHIEVTNRKSGETSMKWKTEGYYGRLSHVVDHIVDDKLYGDKNAKDLNESIAALRNEVKELKEELLKKIDSNKKPY